MSRAGDKFRPTVFNNQRPILTPHDLDDHPRATEYIAYNARQKYPLDFKAWLNQQETRAAKKARQDRERVTEILNDPFCRSPIKRRRIL